MRTIRNQGLRRPLKSYGPRMIEKVRALMALNRPIKVIGHILQVTDASLRSFVNRENQSKDREQRLLLRRKEKQEEKELLEHLAKKGLNLKQMGWLLGLTRQGVRQLLASKGIAYTKSLKAVPPEMVRELVSACLKGFSVQELSSHYGFRPGTIDRSVRQAVPRELWETFKRIRRANLKGAANAESK